MDYINDPKPLDFGTVPNSADYNNDPRLVEQIMFVRAENSSLYREVQSLREMNDFLRQIINTLMSK